MILSKEIKIYGFKIDNFVYNFLIKDLEMSHLTQKQKK